MRDIETHERLFYSPVPDAELRFENSGAWDKGSCFCICCNNGECDGHETHAKECPGTGKPVGAGSRCRECGQSFGWPHPANLVVGMPAPNH